MLTYAVTCSWSGLVFVWMVAGETDHHQFCIMSVMVNLNIDELIVY